MYDETRQLIGLAVQLIQQVSHTLLMKLVYHYCSFLQMRSSFDKCSFHQLLSYTVVLGDRIRERVDQRMISCNKNICSISFPLSLSDRTAQSYFVRVSVSGAFGSNSTSKSISELINYILCFFVVVFFVHH